MSRSLADPAIIGIFSALGIGSDTRLESIRYRPGLRMAEWLQREPQAVVLTRCIEMGALECRRVRASLAIGLQYLQA